MRFSLKEAQYWPLSTCTISKKTNEEFSRKFKKSPFWPRFDHFLPKISRTRIFLDSRLGTHLKDHKGPLLTEQEQNLMTTFRENSKRALFWPLLAPNLDPQIFYQKSGFVTFCPLLFFNIMPSFVKILWSVFEKNSRQTNELTNELTNERGPIYRTNLLESVGVRYRAM